MDHKSQCSPTMLQGNIGWNITARRQSAIYRRDTPRSLRDQRNLKRRQSRPRSVRDSINPEHRRLLEPIHYRRMRAFSLLKPVRRIFWMSMSQARIRTSLRCSINETEKKKLQLLNKQPLARSLRDLQFASYGRPRRQAYKASSSTGAA